jgi:hypothetical protein
VQKHLENRTEIARNRTKIKLGWHKNRIKRHQISQTQPKMENKLQKNARLNSSVAPTPFVMFFN